MNSAVSYEEYLDRYGSLTYTSVGTSMLPLLRQGRDLFTVRRKGAARCRVGDVVLYRRPPDQYVLHRIVAVRPSDYVILGDNCVAREYGVTDADILGVMTDFVRAGRARTVDAAGYRLYTFVWLHTAALRIFLKRSASWLRRRIRSLDTTLRLKQQ